MSHERYGIMTFVGAKSILRSYANYRAYHNGRPLNVLAKEEGVSQKEIKKRLRRIENYISNGQLEYMVTEAKRAVGWTVRPMITRSEIVPVRCSSGCRFTPL